MIAGSADVISFLGWGGLFVTHVTGNLAILAAHLVTGNRTGVGLLLSVPAVVLVLALTRLAAGLDAVGVASPRPLLLAGLGGGMVTSPNVTLTLQSVPVRMAVAAGGRCRPPSGSAPPSARRCWSRSSTGC